MFRDVTFGQYYPTRSFMHSMDARVKILLNILYLVGIFFITSFAVYGFLTVLLVVMIACSRVPLKSILRSLRGILFLLLLTVILNIFLNTSGKLLWQWWIFSIYDQGLYSAAKLFLRLVYLVMGASLLTLTTTPVDLTHAIESLLKPLKLIRVPVHELALIMSLTLSFIPSLMEETDRIIRAQKARGANFDTGGLIKRAKAFVPILIPLLVSSFRRAEELANAMSSRCYGGPVKRTSMRVMRIGWRDVVATLVMLIFWGGVITLYAMSGTLSPMVPWLYF